MTPRDHGCAAFAVFGVIAFGMVAFALLNFGDGWDEKIIRSVENHGLTDVIVTGWSPFACSNDDDISRGFTAKAADGRRVEGTVCCGVIWKGCTVRW